MWTLFLISLCWLNIRLQGAFAKFNISKQDNLAIYWGQDGAGHQHRLSYYCSDSTVDVIPLAFLYIFFGKGGMPVIDFANICNQFDDPLFPGTDLAKCSTIASDIKTCQAKGKIVTLSLGGATGQVGFAGDKQAKAFASLIWNEFLGGNSSTRPFGDAKLDGVDLDIESGSGAHYGAFIGEIRHLSAGASKKYYISGAPQCPFPDLLNTALTYAHFDMVYVQFYNNYCGLDTKSFNFNTWDHWAKNTARNKDVKVYIGAPGSSRSAGTGYVDVKTLAGLAKNTRQKYSSFGGVMLWDMDTSYTNNRFDKAIKQAMVSDSADVALPPSDVEQVIFGGLSWFEQLLG